MSNASVPEAVEGETSLNILDYVTVPDAAKTLDVHPETVRTAIKQGRLPAVSAFGKTLIAKSELSVYVERTRPKGVKPRGRPKKTSLNSPE